MSIEQVLLLLFFVIIPLVQSLLARRKGRAAEADAENDSPLEALFPEHVERRPPVYVPPPPVQSPRPEPVPAVARRSREAVADPHATRAAAAPIRPPVLGAKQRAQSRHLSRLVPRDVEGLRRAVLMAELLGPPRSLDRWDPLRR